MSMYSLSLTYICGSLNDMFTTPHPGTWVLDELERQYPRNQPNRTNDVDSDVSGVNVGCSDLSVVDVGGSDISGVEAVSPHKLIAAAQESPLEIPGIGEICMSWIGLKGVRDIRRMMAEEEARSQVKALKSELRVLAKECTKAYEAAGIGASEEPQIKRAVDDLCASYLSQPARH